MRSWCRKTKLRFKKQSALNRRGHFKDRKGSRNERHCWPEESKRERKRSRRSQCLLTHEERRGSLLCHVQLMKRPDLPKRRGGHLRKIFLIKRSDLPERFAYLQSFKNKMQRSMTVGKSLTLCVRDVSVSSHLAATDEHIFLVNCDAYFKWYHTYCVLFDDKNITQEPAWYLTHSLVRATFFDTG